MFPDTTEANIHLEEKWKLLKCLEKMEKGKFIFPPLWKSSVYEMECRGDSKNISFPPETEEESYSTDVLVALDS